MGLTGISVTGNRLNTARKVSEGAKGRLAREKNSKGTHLHIFQTVLLADASQHILLTALL